MAQATTTSIPTFTTVADVLKVTGDVPAERVRLQPVPGTATEDDVVRVNESKIGMLCELVDGVLVEKTVGHYESYLAMQLGIVLGNFVRQQKLGVVHGADGMMRLMPGLIRIPDVSFTTWEQIQGMEVAFKKVPAIPLSPDLAVEVLSPNNTKREMDRKLREYFEAGVRLVWYVYPATRSVRVYTSPDDVTELSEDAVIEGGDVLRGFQLPLPKLFVMPRHEDQ